MNLGTAQVIRANSRHLPLADNSVDLCISSPPYWSLRSYQDGGSHYSGQIGDEPTPAAFVDSLIEVTRELVRVTKPSGSIWINLGDKYSTGSSGDRNNGFNERSGNASGKRAQERSQVRSAGVVGMQPKSLIGIPWRYALRCIDDLGLILRAEVIWSKPNGLPESVTDRVRRSHEQWFHFTLQPRYFSAVDEIRESTNIGNRPVLSYTERKSAGFVHDYEGGGHTTGVGMAPNPLGKLPGSVWTVPTEPLRVPDHLGVDHFAAFPTEFPKRIIQGWSPAGVCVECGEGRRPVKVSTRAPGPHNPTGQALGNTHPRQGDAAHASTTLQMVTTHVITGYTCACTIEHAADEAYFVPPTTPGVVLDPFGGTGTTAMVAKALGRHGISVDMSADYCRLAEWRTNDRNQLAKVLGVAKADAPDADQLDLFGGEVA